MSINIVLVNQPPNNMGIQGGNLNPTPVTSPASAYKSSVTTKLATGASQALIPARTNRAPSGVNITNFSLTASLWVCSDINDANVAGTAAIVGLPSIEIPPGNNYDFPITGQINGIWGAGFLATEKARMIEYV
jgi:hypothetical protein